MMCDYTMDYSEGRDKRKYACSHPPLKEIEPDGRHLCIFHSTKEDKDAAFYEDFKTLYERYDHVFIGFIFPKNFDFNKLRNETGELVFTNARFQGAVFRCKANLLGAEFEGDAGTFFNGAEFSSDGGAYFRGARFTGKGKVDFTKARFLGKAGTDFSWAVFSGDGGVSFSEVEFLTDGGIYFIITEFLGKGDVQFDKAQFTGDGGVSFYMARFAVDGAVSFAGAEFTGVGWSNFRGIQFKVTSVNFNGMRLNRKGVVSFSGETFIGATKAYFVRVEIENPENMVFDRVKLHNIRFLGTNLRRITFNEVFWRNQEYIADHGRRIKRKKKQVSKWNWVKKYLKTDTKKIGGLIWSKIIERIKIYDEELQIGAEKRKGDEQNHYNVQQLYDQLRMNYEETGRYHEAGDFFVGAMEMRRKGKREKWLIRKALFWYKWISLYGERPARAFGWLIVLLFFFGVIYSSCNLEPVKDISETIMTSGFGRGLMISLSNLTLGRIDPLFSVLDPVWGNIWKFAETILGGVVLSLFLLAMNRKFRRVKD
jgi:uncharacterized protein YjbI with pentapeptide repeats